ncbi:MAG TPA: UvrB/UvrC motif-containing protein [bacterium]|mgnify:FL=1|nr:UvrB/UvrC motif-containing protein [bacterium]
MLCDNCKKNEANIHFTQIIDDKKKEVHLCEDCAKKNEFFKNFNFLNFNSDIEAFEKSKKKNKENVKNAGNFKSGAELMKCENCGLDFNKFRKIGKISCAQCYKYFGDQMEYLISRIHNNVQHIGKCFNKTKNIEYIDNIKTQEKINELKMQLEEAVQKEDYEKAIFLRDEIKKLSNQ